MEQLNMTAISVLSSSITAGSTSPASNHYTVFWMILIVLLVALIACIPGALQCVGFTATGVVEGSFAALWQSSIAIANGVGIVMGSPFAILQSIAMGGFMCAFACLYVIIALAVVAALVSIFVRRDEMVGWFEVGFEHAHVFVVHVWKEILQWVDESEWWAEGVSITNYVVGWFEAGFEHAHVFVVHVWKEILQWVGESEWWAEGVSITNYVVAWFEAGFEHAHMFVVHVWKEILQWVDEWWAKGVSSTNYVSHVMNACTSRKCLL